MSEKNEIKKINAKAHKNSGRGNKKGDATWKNFTVDFKEVEKSFTINKTVWAKAVTDAIKNNNDPMIITVLGKDSVKTRLAIIEFSLLEDIMNGV
jgi:outer membrane phospholipase A